MTESVAPEPQTTERRTRNSAVTKQKILVAATAEFAEHGLSGARIDAIAQRADVNMRMLYHYYGSKEDLYVTVLEQIYEDIRRQEKQLNLGDLEPSAAMLRLFEFTFAHFAANPEVISLWTCENMLKGKFLAQSRRVADLSSPLLMAIEDTLRRGEQEGTFRKGIDPLQLYVSMVALSYFHLSNAYTLSTIFRANLHSRKWKLARRRHAIDMLMSFLHPDPAGMSENPEEEELDA